MAMWHVSRGNSRLVIAIPSLGIAIKCARIKKIHLMDFFRNAYSYAKKMLPGSTRKKRAMYWENVIVIGGYYALWRTFRGVLDNWSERSFYKHTDALSRLVLQPTHFSFLGLVNIQRYGEPAEISDCEPIYHAFFQIASEDLIRDGHHWVMAHNFHLAVDGPKLLDYGSERTREIISKYGVALYTDFDIHAGRAQTEKFKQARRAS